ncbi:MAG: hypothetical protein N2169_07615, partial [bacterium]|nr:hypothetical protein [bacterium]
PNFFLTYKLNSILEHDPFTLFDPRDLNSSADRDYRMISPKFLYNTIKFKSLLGFWSLSNIEIIKLRKKGNEKIIEYHDIPQNVAVVLADNEIVNYLLKINEEKVFEIVINLDFYKMERLYYLVLRQMFSKEDGNPELCEYINKCKDKRRLKNISRYISLIYARLYRVLDRGGSNMQNSKIDSLIYSLLNLEINDDVLDSIDNMLLRLLEQVRIGNKENVYYILLRCFVVNKVEFPPQLSEIFKEKYDKHFKMLMFSFLSNVSSKLNKENKK